MNRFAVVPVADNARPLSATPIESSDCDLGDYDRGDYDQTEVDVRVNDVWHPSFELASLPAPAPATEFGKAYLQSIRLVARVKVQVVTLVEKKNYSQCWKDTDEAFKRLIARSAGLSLDVVSKLDKDLTEGERACIRAAAKRLDEKASALFAI